MYDLIIRGARLSDEQVVDIALQDGRIAAIGKVQGNAQHERDLAGRYYLSAGWIDSTFTAIPNHQFIMMKRMRLVLRMASPRLSMRAAPAQSTLMTFTG